MSPARKPDAECAVDRREDRASTGDYCHTHYEYKRRTGKDPYLRDAIGRFMAKVDKHETGCWLWTGTLSAGEGRGAGYGRFKYQDKLVMAHRFSYEWFVGPIPEGLHVDHHCHDPSVCITDRGAACEHRRCVNPEHLAPATPAENLRRSTSPSTMNSYKTHCMRGHEFTDGNTYVSPQGKRACRTCAPQRYREFRERQKAERQQGDVAGRARMTRGAA